MTATRTGRTATPDVVIVGRANVDLTITVPHRPTAGRTVFATSITATPGGKALNQAIAVARLDGNAALLAGAGDDAWGHQLRNALTDAGVETSCFLLRSGATTGAAIVEVTPDGESYVVLAVSPDTELTSDEIRTAPCMHGARVVVTQLDLPPAAVTAVLEAPRPDMLIGNLVPHSMLPRAALAALDLIVVNEHEAAAILGQAQTSASEAAIELRRLGPATAVITAGPAGAAYSSPAGSGAIPARPVTPVDTTGAGDAFLGSLALHLAHHKPLPDAVAHAVETGTLATQHHGALLPHVTQ